MKKNTKIKLILLVIFSIIVGGIFYKTRQNNIKISDDHKKIILNEKDITLVKTLKTAQGEVLGDVNVTYINNNVFSSLFIVKNIDGKNVILYKINSDGFFNVEKKEMEVSKDKFYGYQFSLIKDSYFVLHLLGNGGKDISDDYTIEWNPVKKIFEIQQPSFEDLK